MKKLLFILAKAMVNNNTNNKMRDRMFNALPIGGASLGGVSPVISNINTISWHGIGDLAVQAAIFAFVGGLIGWGVKYTMDRIVKKKK